MKQCPRCHAVVRDDYECPFCHETLTYEPPVMQDKPHTPLNRYTVLYWAKALWFPLVALLVCTVRLLTLPGTKDGFLKFDDGSRMILIGFTLLACFLAAIFSGDPFGWTETHHFSEHYYKFRCDTIMFVSGTAAIALSFLLFL